jgi:signal transduction histidine kinase/ActR/RegA family two-component response regulator
MARAWLLVLTVVLAGCVRRSDVATLPDTDRVCFGTVAACAARGFEQIPVELPPNLQRLPGATPWQPVTVAVPLGSSPTPRQVAVDGSPPEHCAALRMVGEAVLLGEPRCAHASPLFVDVPPSSRDVEVLVSSRGVFDPRSHKPRLVVGAPEAIRGQAARQTSHVAFVCGWLLLVAGTALNGSIIGRQRRANIALAILAVVYAAHTITNARSGLSGLSLFGPHLDRRIELASMGVIIAAGIEFYGLLAPLVWLRARQVTQAVVLFLAAANLLAPMPMLVIFLRTTEIVALVWALMTGRLVWAWQASRPVRERAVVVLGILVLIVGSTVDTVQGLLGLPIYGTVGLTSYSFAFELFCQSLLVAMQNADAHTRAERLAEETVAQRATILAKNAELERLARLKDAFLSNTTHELRTPIHGIVGLTEATLRTEFLDPSARTRMEMVLASGRRLGALVNDILDFGKLKDRGIRLQSADLELRDAVTLAIASVAPMADAKRLSLTNTIPYGIVVHADPNRVQQVLLNLLGNAVKFTERGHVVVRASRTGKTPLDRRVRIEVEDTGLGIPAEAHGRIFESFEQADESIAERFGGTGLGLPIARRLVELHGGTLTVTSSPGKGSTFVFDLPEAERDEDDLEASNHDLVEVYAAEPANDSVFDGRDGFVPPPLASASRVIPDRVVRARVLVADDAPANLEVLRALLEPAGFALTCTADGESALRAFETAGPFDAVLLDVMMPRVSGLEVARRLRSRHPRGTLPIVLLSAKGRDEDVVAGFEAGADDYVQKPFSTGELLARLEAKLPVA